jgi:23S rRNA (cytosine1962-C5)-methyltransferase
MSPAAADSLPSVTLRARDARRVQAGHPWVFDSAVDSESPSIPDGAIVRVEDASHRLLGIGPYNSKSRIRVRLIAREVVAIDGAYFERRIRAALSLRERFLPGATSYRVLNSESDLVSGLIVDRYEDVLVVQIASLGLEQRKETIVAALERVCSPRAILERSDGASRRFEGLEPANGLLAGSLGGDGEGGESSGGGAGAGARRIEVRLNGLRFEVDLETGHKTGLYLDQQPNYQAVSRFAKGARVLDCFSFLGGFGLHAARAGALRVQMLDQSEDAVAASLRNAELNGLASRCEAQVTNVFDWLKAKSRKDGPVAGPGSAAQTYDLIVLDPPSFTRNRSSVPDALRGYKEIHLRALRLLAPGGVLATFCCSHHVDTKTFQDVIQAAAFDARVLLRRVASYSQSPDHPVIPAIPETEYLKGFAFERVDESR